MLLSELEMTFHRIGTHAKNDGIQLLKLIDGTRELYCLACAAAGVVFGVEVKDNPLAFEIGQASLLIIFVW